jgi:hypothetical protein
MYFRAATIAALVLILAGCGPRLVYPQLDWLIPWYVDDYLSLNDTQQSEFSIRLDAQLAWHCRTQMPAYARFLRTVRREVETTETPITKDMLAAHYAALHRYVTNLAQRAGPDLARILMTADDVQVAELFDNIDRRNEKLKRKYLSPSPPERREQRTDRMISRLERWTGKLDTDQRGVVGRWSEDVDITGPAWMENRLRVQARFRELIDRRRRDPEFAGTFSVMLADPERLRSPDYQRLVAANRARTMDLLVHIGSSLTATQRSRLVGRLSRMADDFDALSCPVPVNATRPAGTAFPAAKGQRRLF